MTDQPDRQDGDGLLPAVNARVRQSGVDGGTRDGIVIKSTAYIFTVKWDACTMMCTYNSGAMKSDQQCPITVLSTRDGVEETENCKRRAWEEECDICGNVGIGPCRVPPKPAPDAMREAIRNLAERHVGMWLQKDGVRLQIVPTAARQDIRDFADAVLKLVSSAPVPPADGLSSPAFDRAPHNYGERLPSSDAAANVGEALQSPTVAAEPRTDDKELGKKVGSYLGMSGINAEDIAYLRKLIATPPVSGDREAIARILKSQIRTSSPADDVEASVTNAEQVADAILSLFIQHAINKTKLYTALNKFIPQDMIDSIWQAIQEATS